MSPHTDLGTDRTLDTVDGAHAPSREQAILRYYSALAEELRAPLNALYGWMELLALTSGSDHAGEAQQSARIVLDRLRRLCGDAGDSAAVALGELRLRTQAVDLTEAVATAASSTAPARFEPAGRMLVTGDRERLTQTVVTVLSATAAYGPVTATLRATGEWATLTVSNGRAVPFEIFQGLFGPFSCPPGFGDPLGLYVCRAIVEAHGGQIGVGSGDEGETTLWLRRPLRRDDHPAA